MPSSADRHLDWRGERLSLRPANVGDAPALVALHRQLAGVPAPAGDASPEEWFRTGGPWMHERFCSRHIQAYRDLGWDCWVLERNGEAIAGSVEVLYATEPEPFGRQAHLELLELAEDVAVGEVEHWVLDQCESRARARGFDRFWCRPVRSGGSWDVPAACGYAERRWNAWLRVAHLDAIEPPAFEARPLDGDYDREASGLLALAVAAREASSLGASALDVVVPEGLSSAIQPRVAATVVPLERGDPWLVKHLGLRVGGT